MGVNGTSLEWFTNYLSGRTQRVDIDGNLSDELYLDISVIQGSILGPILFLCFYAILTIFTPPPHCFPYYLRMILLAYQKEKI